MTKKMDNKVKSSATCRSCGEPLKATRNVTEYDKSFAITPVGFTGPLIFKGRRGGRCGHIEYHSGGAMDVGLNLQLRDGHIIAGVSGSLTAESVDSLIGNLILIAEDSDIQLPWVDALMGYRIKRKDDQEK